MQISYIKKTEDPIPKKRRVALMRGFPAARTPCSIHYPRRLLFTAA